MNIFLDKKRKKWKRTGLRLTVGIATESAQCRGSERRGRTARSFPTSFKLSHMAKHHEPCALSGGICIYSSMHCQMVWMRLILSKHSHGIQRSNDHAWLQSIYTMQLTPPFYPPPSTALYCFHSQALLFT